MRVEVNRRTFLYTAAAVAAGYVLRWPATAPASTYRAQGGVTAWRRSGRGRHVSNAAKKHNANHLYSTFTAAAADPAHPGDKSKVVPVTISASLYAAFFGSGRDSVDLRHDLWTLGDFAALQACHTGPARAVSNECTGEDFNGDAVIDLHDISRAQHRFTGR